MGRKQDRGLGTRWSAYDVTVNPAQHMTKTATSGAEPQTGFNGTATVLVTAAGTQTHAAATKEVAVTVGRANISDADVTLAKTSYTCNGEARKPRAKVTLGGVALQAGTDFSVLYKNNVKPGTAYLGVRRYFKSTVRAR